MTGCEAEREAWRPSRVRDARDVPRFDEACDVLVVGLGCAGACAAIEAVEAGADVLVLERASGGGGTSALSGGLLYLGGGTPVQKACGFEDTPEAMLAYLMASCGPGPDEAKLRLFAERSVEHFHWLVDRGVPFKESFHPESGTEPPTEDGLIFSGSERAWPFRELAPPAPRGHHPRHPGAAGGFLMQRLLAAATRAGPRVRTDARCETLVVEGERVVGALVRADGEERAVRARRGVVLATGGFIENRAMLERHAPDLLRCSYRVGCPGDDGSGIRMGMGAGGAAIRMESGSISLPYYPPGQLKRGILVDAHGQRFAAEDLYYGRVGETALLHRDGRCWLVVDDESFARPLGGMRVAAVGETVEELEGELGLPEGALVATVELYNRHAARGEDPVFHKAPEHVAPLARPPFGALDCTRENAIYAAFTLGGLHTAPQGEVMTPDGEPVPGLFAAGRATSGVAARGYSSGISLADGTLFGRLAGARAARGRD